NVCCCTVATPGTVSVPLTTTDFSYRARSVHGSRLALVDEPGVMGSLGRLTYSELFRHCDGFMLALKAAGITSGDRIAIISPNAAKLLIALYAVTGAGCILVPINFRLGTKEVQYIVDDAEASALLVDPEFDEQFADV